MAKESTHWSTSGRSGSAWRTLSRLLAAAAMATVLGSCTLANQRLTSSAIRIPGSSPVSDAPSASNSPIVSAWLAAEAAFEEAALTSDPDQPELIATTIAPQLPWTRSVLAQMQSAGQVARGPVDYGRPRVVTQGSGLATVQSCEHDGEVVVSLATGQPVPGDAGQVDFELFTSTMELTDTGWKLATQTVGVGTCHES